MKINSSYPSPAAALTPRVAPKESKATDNPSAAEVSLSALASTVKSNEKPPVDSARIQEIKTAIAQGKFTINPEAIADGLIESARDLIAQQRKS